MSGFFELEGDYGRAMAMRSHARELGPDAVAPLREVATHGATAMRAIALQTLVEIDPDGSEAFVLSRIEEDRDPEVVEAAVRGLGVARGRASFELLGTIDREPRAARIALHQRLGAFAAGELCRLAEEGPTRASDVAIEILSKRREIDLAWLEATTEKRPAAALAALDSLAAHPDGARAARVLGVALRALDDDDDDELLAALGALTEAGKHGGTEALDEATRRWLDPGAARDRHLEAAFARVAVERDPRRVFDELAPIVARGTEEGTRGELVIGALLEQLEDAFVAADGERGVDENSPPRGRVPDARWTHWLEVVAPVTPPISPFAVTSPLAALRAALAWAHLPRTVRGPRIVVCGAEEGVPFVVAGFDAWTLGGAADAVLERIASTLGPAATELHLFHHQCGGMACAQRLVLGLPLSSAAFARALVHDGDAVQELASLVSSSGPYSPAALAKVHRVLLETIPALPPLVEGEEAAVSTVPCDVERATAGLEVVRVLSDRQPWLRHAWVDPVLRPAGPLTAEHAARLVEVGRELGLGRPCVHVLWANSD